MVLRKINIYLVSDASGETVLHVANAVLAQFEGLHINKFMWPMMRSPAQIDHLMRMLEIMPGIILYTLVDEEIEAYLKSVCQMKGVQAFSILAQLMEEMGEYFHEERVRRSPGKQHKIFDQDYEKRIEALDFTLAHDDGQKTGDINNADIVIIGVSRTSKSPTSLYLAQRGFKTANIPFVQGVDMPIQLHPLPNTLVIGLTINPEKLKSIRQTRLASLHQERQDENSYTDLIAIRDEIVAARKFFAENNITVIDVTNKAIEETSAEIINIYQIKFMR